MDPCVNVPLWPLKIAKIGAGSMVMVSLEKVPVVMPAPLKVNPLTIADAGALLATLTSRLSSG